MKTVSIIIPVYNVKENYIKRCISSILNQEYLDLEIIIIDDGSCSEIAKLCDSFETLDSRIKVYHKENEGVSIARNYGTKIATGDYIVYVDSDDIISSSAIPSAVRIAEEKKLDIVIGAVKKLNPDEELKFPNNGSAKLDIYGENALQMDNLREYYLLMTASQYRTIDGNGYIGRGPVARLIKADIAKRCPFIEGLKLGEDVVWNMALLNMAERVGIVYETWYGYVIYTSSSARKYYGNRREILEKYLHHLWEVSESFCETHKASFAKNIAMEFNGYLTQEILSNENPLSSHEKSVEVKNCLLSMPWSIMLEKDIYKKLPKQYKALVFSCKIGLWKQFVALESIILRR